MNINSFIAAVQSGRDSGGPPSCPLLTGTLNGPDVCLWTHNPLNLCRNKGAGKKRQRSHVCARVYLGGREKRRVFLSCRSASAYFLVPGWAAHWRPLSTVRRYCSSHSSGSTCLLVIIIRFLSYDTKINPKLNLLICWCISTTHPHQDAVAHTRTTASLMLHSPTAFASMTDADRCLYIYFHCWPLYPFQGSQGGCWSLSNLHVGEGRVHPWLKHQLTGRLYLRVWFLAQGTSVMLWSGLAVHVQLHLVIWSLVRQKDF